MRFVEAITIYLAIGAPLAMMYFFRNRRKPAIQLIAITLAAFVLWLPIVLLDWIRWFQKPTCVPFHTTTKVQGTAIERRIHVISGHLGWSRETVELRESLGRYAALTWESSVSIPGRPSETFEIFTIAANRNEVAGSACLARRNRSKLADHQQRAAADLFSSAQKIANHENGSETTVFTAAALARELGDHLTASRLMTLLDGSDRCGSITESRSSAESAARV